MISKAVVISIMARSVIYYVVPKTLNAIYDLTIHHRIEARKRKNTEKRITKNDRPRKN